MKSQGLGDSIEKFTTKTGIKTIVDSVSEGLNIPCGCQQRRAIDGAQTCARCVNAYNNKLKQQKLKTYTKK